MALFSGIIRPKRIRIDASTVCQLRCHTCPTAEGKVAASIGSGFLKYSDFKKFMEKYPFIKDVELSNYGEIFLNPEIIDIMKYACSKNIRLHADGGANLNTMNDELIEALVKYRFRSITCSIDGADNDTYQIYRRRGNFNNVIENLKRINKYKNQYSSRYPKLRWQYIAFGHNEGSICRAREMAYDLSMNFYVKLSWGNMYSDEIFSPINDKELIRKETGLNVADRDEYHRKYGVSYVRLICRELWRVPQINYDGRVLGCGVNFWGDYGNVFQDDLIDVLNNEKMNYARAMLMGKKPARDDIPCTRCKLYDIMRSDRRWLSWKDIGVKYRLQSLIYNAN
jgi:MoaA/NifB/PqqE/SkfB family radical SAM enzyme